jgi:hypothetical protein
MCAVVNCLPVTFYRCLLSSGEIGPGEENQNNGAGSRGGRQVLQLQGDRTGQFNPVNFFQL